MQTRQFQTVITLQSRRGAIVDRNGRDLALSMKAYSVFADPKLIEKRKATAKKLGGILNGNPDIFLAKIKDKNKRFVWIQRLIDDDKADRLRALDIKGIQVVEEYKRVYPNEELLSQVMGFVGQDGQGLEGLEKFFEQSLQGNKKKITVRRDARGRPLVADGLIFAENPDGAEIKLTVDADLQHTLQTELNQAIREYDADDAIGVILDAKTSAILAMSSEPSFDANRAQKLKPEQRRNRAVTDAFEPGSTMKAFVIASALREKIVRPNSRYNTENGHFNVGDRVIREAETKEKWQSLTVSEILAYSSNIGTTKIAFDLGSEALQKALADFGFGQKTGVDLPGDGRGLMQPLPWRPHLLANISFGHGVAATSLQIANAYASIANGGTLNTPFIVQSVRDPDTGEITESQSKPIRRVLSTEDAASLRLMLTGATAPGGTGVNAKVDGFIVAGKTGTAQKVDAVHGGYLAKSYVSSFAGFIPATDPRFVIFIMVDNPKKNAYYGSQIAAPIFSRMASYAVRRAGIAPMILSEKNFIDKNLMGPSGQKRSQKKEIATSFKISNETRKKMKDIYNPALPKDGAILTSGEIISGSGKKTLDKYGLERAARTSASIGTAEVSSTTMDASLATDAARTADVAQAPNFARAVEIVPELMNLTLREVLRRVSAQDLSVKTKGQGLVSEVFPPAGSPVPANKKIMVILKSPEETH